MINRLFILCLGVFTASAAVYAEEAALPPRVPISRPDFSVNGLNKLLDQVAAQAQTGDDLLLNSLLAVPFDKRQYVFPQLHENTGLGKKILSHPEIKIWKGKQPTDIPPNLQAFAKEHLAYLPASYYIFLDPDYWQAHPTEQPNGTPTISDTKRQLKLTPHQGTFYTFPSVQSLYQLSDKTRATYKQTDLTGADVTRLFATIPALDAYIAGQNDPRDINMRLISLMLRNNQVEKDLTDPFLSLATRLKMVLPPDEIESFFQKQGWSSADEFAQKSDRILKAYRVNFLNPTTAVALQKVRAYPASAPTTTTLENLRMYAKMHEAAPGDVYFVQPYLADIRKNLKPDYILLSGTPIYIE